MAGAIVVSRTAGAWTALVLLLAAGCGLFSDSPNPVGTWALHAINGNALPVNYYAPGNSRYIAFADTLVVKPDGTCDVRFVQGFFRVDVASMDTTRILITSPCSWHVDGDVVHVAEFKPSFEPSYPARMSASDALVMDWKFASTSTIYSWAFTRVR